jgi:hypothetical protein
VEFEPANRPARRLHLSERCGRDQPVTKLRYWSRVYLGHEFVDHCLFCGVEYDVRIIEVGDDEGSKYTALMRFRNRCSSRVPERTRERYRHGRVNARRIYLFADEIRLAGQPTGCGRG